MHSQPTHSLLSPPHSKNRYGCGVCVCACVCVCVCVYVCTCEQIFWIIIKQGILLGSI